MAYLKMKDQTSGLNFYSKVVNVVRFILVAHFTLAYNWSGKLIYHTTDFMIIPKNTTIAVLHLDKRNCAAILTFFFLGFFC